MSSLSLIFCGALALLLGFLAQQSLESLINGTLTFLPFKVRTVK